MIKQFLSKKWIPYEEIGEYLIRDREGKIINTKMNGYIKTCIFFILIFTVLLIFADYF